MAKSGKALFIESCLAAGAICVAAHPISAVCGLVISALVEIEPAKELIEKLGEELARAIGIKISERLTEADPRSLSEAFLLALSNAIEKVRQTHRRAFDENAWGIWADNWRSACERVCHHQWEDVTGLVTAIGNLNRQPKEWQVLRETLILLDWSARLGGDSDANRVDMPPALANLLERRLAAEFIEELKELLASGNFGKAVVEMIVDLASRSATPPIVRRPLTGPADPRLRPMRGYFTGRADQVQQVQAFLAGAQKLAVVTGQLYNVQGGPGIGKTELCKAALRAHLRRRPETRAYYIDVTGVRGADTLRLAMAKALGDQRLSEGPPIALLNELRSQTDLIYLDNLEDALPEQDDASAEVFRWLDAMVQHEIKVLASSRRTLGSVAQEFPLGRLPATEARELFEHFWKNAGGAPLEDPEPFHHFIEHDLDCHALTIRLLAAQASEWGTWQNLRAEWLKYRTSLAKDAGRPDRLSNLDVSISLTFDQVAKNPVAAELWIAFACFPDGMSTDAQQAIVPDDAQRREALSLLHRLGVIYRGARLEMLAPLRQFAVGRDRALTLPVWERCLLFLKSVAATAQRTELGGGDQRSLALRTLAAEFGNLRESMFLWMEKGSSADLLEQINKELRNSYQLHSVASRELLEPLDRFFFAHGCTLARANTLQSLGDLESQLSNPDRARQLFEEALPLFVSERDNVGRANTLLSRGILESRFGNPDRARQLFEEALPLIESEQYNMGRANTLKSLGDLESRLGNVDRARQLYDQALPLYESEQNDLGRANTLKLLGDLERRLGNVDRARQLYDQALPLYESEQDNLGRANTLRSLGDLERRLGNVDRARQLYDQALPLYESEQANLGRANTLTSLGDLESRLGNVDRARQLYDQALPLYESEQDNLGRANTLTSLGDLESRLGNVDRARQLYDQALPLYESEQDNLGRANTLRSLGDLESRLGNVDRARRLYDQALPLYESEQANLGRANTLRSLGDLESRLGNVDRARQLYDQALPLYESEQDNLGRANTLKSLGDLESRLGNVDRARQLYDQALPLYESEQDPVGIAVTNSTLAILFHLTDEADAAATAAAKARAAARAANAKPVIDYVEQVLTPLGL